MISFKYYYVSTMQHDVPPAFFFRRSHYLMLVFGWSSMPVFLCVALSSWLLGLPPHYQDVTVQIWILVNATVILSVDLFTLLFRLGGAKEKSK